MVPQSRLHRDLEARLGFVRAFQNKQQPNKHNKKPRKKKEKKNRIIFNLDQSTGIEGEGHLGQGQYTPKTGVCATRESHTSK